MLWRALWCARFAWTTTFISYLFLIQSHSLSININLHDRIDQIYLSSQWAMWLVCTTTTVNMEGTHTHKLHLTVSVFCLIVTRTLFTSFPSISLSLSLSLLSFLVCLSHKSHRQHSPRTYTHHTPVSPLEDNIVVRVTSSLSPIPIHVPSSFLCPSCVSIIVLASI